MRRVRSGSNSSGSHSGELNTIRPRNNSTLPLRTICIPAGSCSASHGWLNHVACTEPVPSLTIHSVMGWLVRVRRTFVCQMVPIIVTCSP